MKKHLLSLIWLFTLLLLALSTFSQNTDSNGDTPKANELLKGFQLGKFEISDYNTACYFALAGKPKIAFVYLTKALGDGFSNVKTLNEDSDLQNLHSDTLWHEMIQKAEKNQQLNKKNDDLFFNQKSFWETKFFATPYRADISEDEKISGLSKLWSELKYNFINFDLVPGTNLDSLYFAYLPKIRKTTSTLEYYKLLAEMVAKLHDGHTNVFVPDTLVNEVYARPLLRSRLIEDKVLIVNAYDEALKNQGIKSGLEIVEVNGLPVKQYALEYVIPYQSSSTPQDMNTRAYEYALLAGALTKPVQLTLSDEKGNKKAYTVSRVTPKDRDTKLRLAPFEFSMLKGNVAYVVLNSFGTDSTAKAFSEKYGEISKASAIIFDVRNNGGGSTGPGWSILRYLINKPALVHAWYTRQYRSSYRAWSMNQDVYGGQEKLFPNESYFYNKPVIILTSSRTFSAAEDFAAAFKSLGRGLVVGEATGGSTGQPLLINLPGNGSARICTKRDQFANGDDFVGRGILPDKEVKPTVSDFRKGIDTVLEAALKELQGQK